MARHVAPSGQYWVVRGLATPDLSREVMARAFAHLQRIDVTELAALAAALPGIVVSGQRSCDRNNDVDDDGRCAAVGSSA